MKDDREILDERARRLARDVAPAGQVTTYELLFATIGDEQIAITTRDVRRVAPMPELTPVPGLPPVYLGVVNYEGDVLPVVDLLQLIGDRRAAGETPLMVVLGDVRPEIAIAVTIAEAVVRAPGWHATAGDPIVRGILDGRRTVLDIEALLGDPRLFHTPDGA